MVDLNKLYVTPDEIRNYLGVEQEKYSDTFLQSLIIEKCEYVDRLSNTTWNGRVKRARIKHDATRWKGGFWYGAGIPVTLGHPYIRQVESIEVQWLGGTEDWVQTKTEGRNTGSYWVDYDNGVLYLQSWVIYQGGKEVTVTYTYGRDDLPSTIKELTRLLVIRDLIANERRLFALPEGGSGISFSEYMKYLDERIEMLEELHRALKPAFTVVRELGEVE